MFPANIETPEYIKSWCEPLHVAFDLVTVLDHPCCEIAGFERLERLTDFADVRMLFLNVEGQEIRTTAPCDLLPFHARYTIFAKQHWKLRNDRQVLEDCEIHFHELFVEVHYWLRMQTAHSRSENFISETWHYLNTGGRESKTPT